MIVYIPMEENKTRKCMEEGLDIDTDYNKKIGIGSFSINCISAFLNPDVSNKSYVAVRIDGEFCYIANYDLYLAYELTKNEHFNRMYINSIINLKKYRYGTYRMPEVLILRSVKKEEVLKTEDARSLKDALSAKNDQIYLSFLIEKISEDPIVARHIILDYFDRLCNDYNKITKKVIEYGKSSLYIFIKEENETWTLQI